MTKTDTLYDVIIIGGGTVGLALACALGKLSCTVALVESAAKTLATDHRLIALNYNSHLFFKSLDLWDDLAEHATAIQQVHISQQSRFGTARLAATDIELAALGYVISAQQLNAILTQAAERLTAQKKIVFYRPAQLQTLTQNTDSSVLTLQTPTGPITINGKIIVGADGSHSTVRELLAIPTKTHDYGQHALVTTITTQRQCGIAYERFLKESGVIAMLPLASQRYAVIWSDKTAAINALLQMEEAQFLQTLQDAFGYRLGRLTNCQQRYHYPLQFLYTPQQVHQNVILLGNAAHTLHPIAAQGLNLALYECALFVAHIQAQCEQGQSLSITALQAKLYTQIQFSSMLSHRLASLFSTHFFLMTSARQLGLICFNMLPAIKKQFLRRALGISGHVLEDVSAVYFDVNCQDQRIGTDSH